MTRVTKNPAERKQELVDAAEHLFLEKGYERTAVSDIVRSVGVAQGTFYYYFNSKTDVLEAVLEKNFLTLENELASINNRTDIGPCEKFNRMVNSLFQYGSDRKELNDATHLESNTILHHRLEEIAHTKVIPHLAGAVEAGVAQGRFKAPCPAETTDILFHAMVHLMHEPGLTSGRERRKRVRIAFEHLLVSVLGVEDDAITLKM